MNILDVSQGTKAWFDLRRCKVTGTKLDSVMGSALDKVNLISELISEEATEQTKILRPTEEMERGTAEEVFAIKEFEARTGKVVDRLGICISQEFDWLSLSPDGFIKNEEGKYTEAIEVKSPNSQTAIFYRLSNLIPADELGLTKSKQTFLGIPAQYKWQVVDYFLVNTDLEKLYFVVYDARFIDEDQKLYVVEVSRENELLQEALVEAREALIKFRENWLRWRDIILPTKF